VAVSQSETKNPKGIFALSGGAFSAMHLLQIFRFTSSKPSKSARAPDGKFTRQLTTSFNQRFLIALGGGFLGLCPRCPLDKKGHICQHLYCPVNCCIIETSNHKENEP
jgi:hypothetical protein